MGIINGLKKLVGLSKVEIAELTHGELVNDAKTIAKKAIGMFQEAHDQLDESNKQLHSVYEETSKKAKEILAEAKLKADDLLIHGENAMNELVANRAVQDQLLPFIKYTVCVTDTVDKIVANAK